MDLGRPYRSVIPTLEGDVLVALAGTTRPLTGREVARVAGRPAHSGVLRALTRLTEHGLVHREEAGRALLYTLNREHLAAPAVERVASMRSELFRRIREALEDWPVQPVHASIFGSTARGDADTRSDVDVFLVRDDRVSETDDRWRNQVDQLAGAIWRWTGNRASIVQAAASEVEELKRTRRRVIRELDRDAIPVFGPPFQTWVAG